MPVITLIPEEISVLNQCKTNISKYYVWCGIMALHGLKPLSTVHDIPKELSFYEYEYKDS